LIDYWDKKDPAKDPVNILELSHVPGTTVSTLRAKGFRDAIEGTRFKILESQTAQGTREVGQQVAEAWLLKYSPGEIDGVFVQGTGMGFGLLAAVAAAGRIGEFPIVFIATGSESYQKIVSGELYGSVDQSPILDAKVTIDTALKVANGEKVDFLTYLPITVTTQENLKTAEKPTW
jgi:ABC-type sugar transport system substrate-binding protein